MSVIEAIGLTKRYGKQLAVDRATFTVERGEVFGFLGPNGSGKTTTIGMLVGIISPTAGAFRLFGEKGPGPLHHVRRRMGATLEQPNFYPYLSGWDNLRITANVRGVGTREMEAALAVVGLGKRKKDSYKKYSLGMKQRLALAATMLGDPELIILDEPANGLDPDGMRDIREIILELASRGTTIFLSSHLLWEVERTCTHVAIIKQGRILQQSSVRDIVAGGVVAELRARDLDGLAARVRDFPASTGARVHDGVVVVRLGEEADLAELNRWVVEAGIYVSHLVVRKKSLEEVFMEVTGGDGPEGPYMEEVA